MIFLTKQQRAEIRRGSKGLNKRFRFGYMRWMIRMMQDDHRRMVDRWSGAGYERAVAAASLYMQYGFNAIVRERDHAVSVEVDREDYHETMIVALNPEEPFYVFPEASYDAIVSPVIPANMEVYPVASLNDHQSNLERGML